MAGEQKNSVFHSISNILKGNDKDLPKDVADSKQLLVNNPAQTEQNNIFQQKQQEYLDLQSIKIAKDLYSRSVYYDSDRISAYNDFKAMDQSPEISVALDILSDETTTRNERGEILSIYSENSRIKKILKNLFSQTLNVEFNLWYWTRELLKYGDNFLKLEVDQKLGIYDIIQLPAAEMHKEMGYNGNPKACRYRWDIPNMYFEDFQVAHFSLISDGARLPYGRCLKWDTYIETSNGTKFIKDIIKGDEVYSFDTKTQQKIKTKVLDTVCSGEKNIYKIQTRNNEIESSIEHNFMIYKNNEFLYKPVCELNIGDCLIINKKTITENKIKIDKDLNDSKNFNGYKNNLHLIPEYVNEDFAMLFGFMLGDGWINNNYVCFALGEDDEINKKYVNLLEKFSGRNSKFLKNKNTNGALEFSQITVCSKMLRRILQKNGFVGNVYTKRFPEWIFRAELNIQKAFMKGLYEADGSVNIDKWNCSRYSLELTNEYMIKDAKTLLQRMGKKTGKICNRKRGETNFWGIKTINRKRSFYFYYYNSDIKQKLKYSSKNKLNNDFIIEPIISIENTQKKELVFDIHVENDNHNFYANGIVVHNSMLDPARKIWKQLQLAEDAMLTYRIIRAPERRIFYVEVGNSNPGDIKQLIDNVKKEIKKSSVVDQRTGNVNLKFNPITMEEDFILPQRNGVSSKIDTLPGASNLSDIEDIEYLQNKLFTAIKVPKTYLNYSEGLPGGSTLSQADLRFSRTINRYQEAIILELRRIANIHLYILGFKDDIDNFTLTLTNPSTQQELLKLETMKARSDVFKEMFSSDATSPVSYTWAMEFIMGFSKSEIKQILRQKKIERKMFFEIDRAHDEYNDTGIFTELDKKFRKEDFDPEANTGGEGEDAGSDDMGGGGGGSFGGGSSFSGSDLGGGADEFGAGEDLDSGQGNSGTGGQEDLTPDNEGGEDNNEEPEEQPEPLQENSLLRKNLIFSKKSKHLLEGINNFLNKIDEERGEEKNE